MIDYRDLYQLMQEGPLAKWSAALPVQIAMALDEKRNADIPRWRKVIDQLPVIKPSAIELDKAAISIGSPTDIDAQTQDTLKNLIMQLHPWRKGPFDLFGIHIDAEWRSDWKWDRLKHHIQPLVGRKVLDVGCSNGYHCWRMAGSGADLVIGIDPTPRFIYQYQVMRRFIGETNVFVLPVGIDDVPLNLEAFDTVFSMGVLYHRRSPLDHILQLKDCLIAGGELVLETLIVDGNNNEVVFPNDRYAKMNNVWFIPTPQLLALWVERCGFKNVRIIDITTTTSDEQRTTEWMRFHSLIDFLDSNNKTKTVEGYPAPRRAILLASKP